MAGLLLPGYGGQLTDVLSVLEGGAAQFTTEVDTSRCSSIAVQVQTWAGNAALTAQAKQRFTSTGTLADYGVSRVVVQGDIFRFDLIGMPAGLLSVSFTAAADNAETFPLTVTTTGFPNPVRA